ncbi:hypothetical protein C7974DRAFT_158389 [Boeremia exigua]|uniref:uncharacterized protein n=1 Tax=Boeremia exigua TaxID=749465 RepID=UPI001E8CB449|nr:uncharacterized protein C7974DRAFT_158389 [Boeremia exigua]KAH6638294.1 hypothetical protein C7974DRAFT_158389 [Boeremia exigua]
MTLGLVEHLSGGGMGLVGAVGAVFFLWVIRLRGVFVMGWKRVVGARAGVQLASYRAFHAKSRAGLLLFTGYVECVFWSGDVCIIAIRFYDMAFGYVVCL